MNSFINTFEQIHLMFLNAGQDFVLAMFNTSKSIYDPVFWGTVLTAYVLYIAFKFFKMEIGLNQILNFLFFLFALVIVITITRSESTFYLFVDLIKLPSEIVGEFVTSMIGSVVKEPTSVIADLQIAFSQIGERINIDSTFLHYLILFVYWLFSIALIVILIFCTLVSSFMATFTLGFGIILFPFLIFKVTSSMFFNWLRSFLFFSILPSASMLMMTFIIQIIGFVQNLRLGQYLDLNQVSTIIAAQIVGIIGMWLLVAFVNQIVGSQNPTSAMGGGIIGGAIGAAGALGITKLISKARDGAAQKTMSYAKDATSSTANRISSLSKQTLSKILSGKQEHSNANVPDSKSK